MRQERRLKMKDAIFFRFEEKASAYRMYYEEDVEIEVQGKKYRQKKGKGPLCEDVMSFSDGDVCIIDKDIFIPKEVYIGNNVVIRKGTGFFVERNSGFVEIKDSDFLAKDFNMTINPGFTANVGGCEIKAGINLTAAKNVVVDVPVEFAINF